MKPLFTILIFLTLIFCQSCSKDDDINPKKLAAIIKDEELADYLNGEWQYSFKGVGYVTYDITYTFSRDSDDLKEFWMFNKYQTLIDYEYNTINSKITGTDNKGAIEVTSGGSLKTYLRIEKISEKKMNVYERYSTSKTEGPAKEYTKIRQGR